jgi:very-short-patch-repair endonuclease
MKSKWEQYYGSSPKTEGRAKSLRRESTEAEKLFWKIVRNRAVNGLKFRRQHPIGHFIVDFYCHEVKLAIELDGDVHDVDEVKQYDKARQKVVEELGITLLRFDNEIIFTNPDGVLIKISEHISIVNERPHPDPLL